MVHREVGCSSLFVCAMIMAYVLRHGSTAISPNPEGWQQIPLDKRGVEEAEEAGRFLQDLVRRGYPKPDWGISSDLERAKQTLAIVAKELQLKTMEPMIGLRAYEQHEETPVSYELRNIVAFDIVLGRARRSGTIPLIACHRSSTAFLGKKHGMNMSPDYKQDSLLLEGGLLALTDSGIQPLFRVREQAWPNTKGEYQNA